MSTLNKKGKSPIKKVAVSFEGNVQLAKADEQQLYEALVMTMWGKDSFYESNDERLTRVRENLTNVVKRNNLDFIANAIIYARTVMNIRTMPVILAVEFARELRAQGKSYENLRRVITDVIQRADQITDLYAYALSVFGGKNGVPMAIRRGVADAFDKFNEYQFGKYNSGGAVKLRDVLRIVHPAGKTVEQGALFAKIMKDELETPYTWETELSSWGQKPEGERVSKDVLWTQLVQSRQMGYMALLRNVRNIIDAGVENKVIKEHVAARLSDPDEIKKSKQLPFCFVNAIEALGERSNTSIKDAIEEALDYSLDNLPKLGDNVWIIVDCSGSMQNGYYSVRQTQGSTPIKTASLFASALYMAQRGADNVAVTMFSDNAFHVHQLISRKSSVLQNTKTLMNKVVGGGTNLDAALHLKSTLGFEPDVVVVLSDMQITSLTRYDTKTLKFNKDTIKVAINLEAYESSPTLEDGWYQLGGFSERLFDFVPAMKNKQSVTKVLSQPYFGIAGAKNLFSE